MKKAVYPGTFDPVTNGHLDIIQRAALQFDEIVVAVLRNSEKTPLFSVDERVKILEEATKDIPNVSVASFEGLTVDFVKSVNAGTMIRGLRAVTDFEYELQIAQINRVLSTDIDTMLMVTDLKYAYLSSTIVKELASHGENIERFVPACAVDIIREKYKNK
ncbi:MAG: pantetheine-phosphate adenylyltransferase [Lachnospiraceae bacterium]|nr:pantetheine-phosphate adenylyltransferase [Candidatus Equihabitans merdae]